MDDIELKRLNEASDRIGVRYGYPPIAIRCRTCCAGLATGPIWVHKFWALVDRLRGEPCRQGRCKFVRLGN